MRAESTRLGDDRIHRLPRHERVIGMATEESLARWLVARALCHGGDRGGRGPSCACWARHERRADDRSLLLDLGSAKPRSGRFPYRAFVRTPRRLCSATKACLSRESYGGNQQVDRSHKHALLRAAHPARANDAQHRDGASRAPSSPALRQPRGLLLHHRQVTVVIPPRLRLDHERDPTRSDRDRVDVSPSSPGQRVPSRQPSRSSAASWRRTSASERAPTRLRAVTRSQ